MGVENDKETFMADLGDAIESYQIQTYQKGDLGVHVGQPSRCDPQHDSGIYVYLSRIESREPEGKKQEMSILSQNRG